MIKLFRKLAEVPFQDLASLHASLQDLASKERYLRLLVIGQIDSRLLGDEGKSGECGECGAGGEHLVGSLC